MGDEPQQLRLKMRWRRELERHLLPCGQAITALERAAAVVRPNQRDSSDRAPCSRGGEGGGGGRCRRRAAAAQRQRKGCGLRAPERRRSRGGAPQQRSSGAIDSETSPPPRRAAEPAQPSGLQVSTAPPATGPRFSFLSKRQANNLSTSSRTKIHNSSSVAEGSSCALIQTTQPTGPGCSRQPDRSK